MAYTPQSPEEEQFLTFFAQRLPEILRYKQAHGGDLEGAFGKVTGTPWPEGRSVKLSGGQPEMTKDRTFKSIIGKYVAPIGGGALAALTMGGALPALGGLFGGGGGASGAAAPLAGGGNLFGAGTAAALPAGVTSSLGSIGVPASLASTLGASGVTSGAAAGGGGIMGGLKKAGKALVGNEASSIRSDMFRGAGLRMLGDMLSNLTAPKPQERAPFTGRAAPQRMMETGVSGMGDLLKQMQGRPPLDFSNIQPQSPMEGMDEDPIRKILQGLK